mgnify:CR=1 FL=1
MITVVRRIAHRVPRLLPSTRTLSRLLPSAQAEHHASLLLAVHQAKDLPLLACKLGAAHLAAAVAAILREPGGPRAAAALLAALPPLAAVKFLYDQADPSPCLLPPEVRKTLLGLMPVSRRQRVCCQKAPCGRETHDHVCDTMLCDARSVVCWFV